MIKKILLVLEVLLFIIIIFDYNVFSLINSQNLLRFISIILCIFLSNNLYNKIIFLITAIADFYLLFTQNYILGLCCFIVAQGIRLLYFNKTETSKIILCFSIMLSISLYFKINKIIAVSIGYIILLISNTIYAFKYKNKFIKLGMLLFILCDICVALNYLNLYKLVFNQLIWIFYIPSSILLATSE